MNIHISLPYFAVLIIVWPKVWICLFLLLKKKKNQETNFDLCWESVVVLLFLSSLAKVNFILAPASETTLSFQFCKPRLCCWLIMQQILREGHSSVLQEVVPVSVSMGLECQDWDVQLSSFLQRASDDSEYHEDVPAMIQIGLLASVPAAGVSEFANLSLNTSRCSNQY